MRNRMFNMNRSLLIAIATLMVLNACSGQDNEPITPVAPSPQATTSKPPQNIINNDQANEEYQRSIEAQLENLLLNYDELTSQFNNLHQQVIGSKQIIDASVNGSDTAESSNLEDYKNKINDINEQFVELEHEKQRLLDANGDGLKSIEDLQKKLVQKSSQAAFLNAKISLLNKTILDLNLKIKEQKEKLDAINAFNNMEPEVTSND